MQISFIDSECVDIQQITLEKKVNCHTHWLVELDLRDWGYLDTLKKMQNKKVTLEDDTTLYACGIVHEVITEYLSNKRHVTLLISSFSIGFDIEMKNRVFHSQNQKWSDIFSYLSNNSKEELSIKIGASDFPDAIFEESRNQSIVMQHEETDFQFLTKIAGKLGFFLFILDADKNSCGLSFDKFISKLNISIELDEFLMVTHHLTENSSQIYAKSERYLPFGSTVLVDGFSYVITQMKLEYQDNVTVFFYTFYRDFSPKTKSYQDSKVVHIGRCKVISNEDPDRLGRLQLKCIDMEDTSPKSPVWIGYLPQLTEKDKGVICMPDPNEQVYLIVRGTEGFVLGCVRAEAINQGIDVTANRTVNVREGQLVMTNEVVSVSNKDTKLTWLADELKSESKEINIMAEGQFSFSGEKINGESVDSLVIQSKTILQKASDSLELHGKTILENASSTIEIKGSEVNITGKKVNAITDKFNIK